MIIDSLSQFSDAQAVTATGDTVSTNIVDTLVDSDEGVGEGVHVVFTVPTTVTSAGAATVQFVVQTSADNSTWTDIGMTDAVAKAALVAGYVRPLRLDCIGRMQIGITPIGDDRGTEREAHPFARKVPVEQFEQGIARTVKELVTDRRFFVAFSQGRDEGGNAEMAECEIIDLDLRGCHSTALKNDEGANGPAIRSRLDSTPILSILPWLYCAAQLWPAHRSLLL